MKKRLLTGLSVAWAMGTFAPSTAAAPAAACVPATLEPIASAIPANLPGFALNDPSARADNIHFSFPSGSGTPPTATVTTVGDLVKITPATPFVVGTTYQLDVTGECGSVYPSQKPVPFVITAEAPIPTALGEIAGPPSITTAKLGTTKVSITASYALAAEMKPWASVYALGLELDGRVIETHATVSGDNVQIAATGWCDAASAASPTHSIKLRGRLPFAPLIETSATTATFDCAALTVGNPGASTPVPPPGAAPTSANPGSPASSSGGGCSVAHGASTWSLPLLGLALGFIALVRRAVRKES